ncbi:MAG: hypothetical protein ACKVU4_11090 [Phycisphaerales bacterium]
MKDELDISKTLAPEDVRAGDYLGVVGVVLELLRWECAPAIPGMGPEVARVVCLPPEEFGPQRVVAVCLPLVLVEDAHGRHRMLDVRQVRLARLTERFGKKAFKRLARPVRSGLTV